MNRTVHIYDEPRFSGTEASDEALTDCYLVTKGDAEYTAAKLQFRVPAMR